MASVGNPYENAKAESFMATFKREEVDGRLYRDIRHALRDIGHFLDRVYNRQRLHSALDYRSPVEFEALMRDRVAGIVPVETEGLQGMRRSTAMVRDVGHAL